MNQPLNDDDDILATARQLALEKKFAQSLTLLDQNFSDSNLKAASLRGYIILQNAQTTAEKERAAEYFLSNASLGSEYDQQMLGETLMDMGQLEDAVFWLKKSSEQGSGAASLKLFWALKRQSKFDESLAALQLSHTQKNPQATQKLALLKITGKLGVSQIVSGLAMYFRNIPALLQHVKEFNK